MNLAQINGEAKKELEYIIDEIFVSRIDSILNEKISALSTEIEKNSRGIALRITDFSTEVRSNKDYIEELIDEIKSKSEIQNDELKKIAFKNFESVQNKLSEIQNVNLAEILSKAIKIHDNQANFSEDFVLKLEGAINIHTKNIISNNLENIELVRISQTKLKSDIVTLINGNRLDQKENIQDLGKSLSHFIELENQNNLNLEKQLGAKFQSIEQLNSVLIRDFDEKFKVLKTENEKQVSIVINKSNTALKVLIISNILILTLLLLNYFSILE